MLRGLVGLLVGRQNEPVELVCLVGWRWPCKCKMYKLNSWEKFGSTRWE